MTTEALKSTAITNLDATPVVAASAGEGAPGMLRAIDDAVDTTTAGGVGSTYRMARFPVEAKIKRVLAYIGDVDSNATATWKGDYNVAFSDSTVDGTSPSYQGLIPTSALTGATTSVSSYSSPNLLFGQKVASNSGAVQAVDDLTFNGTFLPADRQNPLWNYFGFQNAQGNAQSPGGFFDILVYVSAAAATAHAGHLGVEVDFVV